MTAPIDFFFDPISPFSYLATTKIDALAAAHGRTVIWRPTLVGITILKVMGLKPVPETPLKSVYFWHDVERLAAIFGVPLRRHGLKGINSLAACRAFLWLEQRDAEEAKALVRRLSSKLWTEALDITPAETVVAEARALGIDTDGMAAAISSPEMKERLSQAVEHAVAKNVFGVPFFIADGEPLWGCDRMWMLDHWLGHGAWPRFDDWLSPRGQ